MNATHQIGSGKPGKATRWLRLLTAGVVAVILAGSSTVGASGSGNAGNVAGMVQAVVTAGTETAQNLQQFFELIRLREASAIAAVAAPPAPQNPYLKLCSAPASDPSISPSTKKSRS